jgi:drug/metabolite transporter (DMT)-like permease
MTSPRSRALLGAVALLLGVAIVAFAGVFVPGDPIVLRALGFGLALGSVPSLARAVRPRRDGPVGRPL